MNAKKHYDTYKEEIDTMENTLDTEKQASQCSTNENVNYMNNSMRQFEKSINELICDEAHTLPSFASQNNAQHNRCISFGVDCNKNTIEEEQNTQKILSHDMHNAMESKIEILAENYKLLSESLVYF